MRNKIILNNSMIKDEYTYFLSSEEKFYRNIILVTHAPSFGCFVVVGSGCNVRRIITIIRENYYDTRK